jgi:hypothetical protein
VNQAPISKLTVFGLDRTGELPALVYDNHLLLSADADFVKTIDDGPGSQGIERYGIQQEGLRIGLGQPIRAAAFERSHRRSIAQPIPLISASFPMKGGTQGGPTNQM